MSGVMTACFKVVGKQPVVIDKLMMREIGPASRWTNFFTSSVGRGSRLQDVVLRVDEFGNIVAQNRDKPEQLHVISMSGDEGAGRWAR